jgi:hypothetical protein
MRFFVSNEGGGLTFATGPSGGGDRNEGQHRFGGFPDAPVILHHAAVRQNKVAAFGGIHGTAAAEPDDGVNASGSSDCEAGFDAFGRGIFAGLIKDGDVEMSDLEKVSNVIRVPGGDDTGIGYQKDLFRANLESKFADALDAAGTEDEPRARLIINRSQPFAFERGRFAAHAQNSDEFWTKVVQRQMTEAGSWVVR